MAAPIPSIEPLKARAGDTIKWTKNFADFPSSTWELRYFLRGPANHDVTATANGNGYLITIAADESVDYEPGVYYFVGKVFDDDESDQHTVTEGRIEIEPCLEDQDTNFEGRTHARVCLDAIKAAIEGRASSTQLEWTIQAAGRSVRHMGPEELRKWLEFYQAQVAAEEAEVAAARGENVGSKVVIEFVKP